MEYLPLLVIALLFWFLIIRPQRRRAAEQSRLWESLQAGEEVLTAGGLYGRIQRLEDDAVLLEVAPETVVKIDKRAVAGRVEPGSGAENRG